MLFSVLEDCANKVFRRQQIAPSIIISRFLKNAPNCCLQRLYQYDIFSRQQTVPTCYFQYQQTVPISYLQKISIAPKIYLYQRTNCTNMLSLVDSKRFQHAILSKQQTLPKWYLQQIAYCCTNMLSSVLANFTNMLSSVGTKRYQVIFSRRQTVPTCYIQQIANPETVPTCYLQQLVSSVDIKVQKLV